MDRSISPIASVHKISYTIAEGIARKLIKGQEMAKVCGICGRGPVYGNNISHAHNRTRRRWELNLQRVRVRIDGVVRRMNVCASCLKQGRVLKAA